MKTTKISPKKGLLATLVLHSLGFASVSVAEEEDLLTDFSDTFDFQTLGGVDGRLEAHGNDLMGDMIDKTTGAITFSHTDVSIPGNSGLEVALRRKLTQGFKYYSPRQQAFSDWALDIPIAYFSYGYHNSSNHHPVFNDGCMVTEPSQTEIHKGGVQTGATFEYSTHLSGITLSIPGARLTGSQSGYAEGLQDPVANWVSGGQGTDYNGNCAEIAIAPDGTQYKFGRHTFRRAEPHSAPAPYYATPPGTVVQNGHQSGQGFEWIALYKQYAVYLITEVVDVHGNYVRYEYNNDDDLTRIYSNDSREITLAYNSTATSNYGYNLVSKVSAHGRDWDYTYTDQHIDFRLRLDEVIFPDGRSWEFNMASMSAEEYKHWNCVPYTYDPIQITHPDGALGTFKIKETRHIKSARASQVFGVEDWAFKPNSVGAPTETQSNLCWNGYRIPYYEPEPGLPFFRALSVVEKKISGSDIPTATWDFEYRGYDDGGPDDDWWDVSTTWTKITEPDGSEYTYTYISNGRGMGLLQSVDVQGYDGASETLSYDYDFSKPTCSATGSPYSDSDYDIGSCFAYNRRPQTQMTHARDGDTYTTISSYNKNGYDFLDYGFPNLVKRFSTVSGSTVPRETVTTYEHKATINVIGLTKRVEQNGRELATYEYDSLGRLESQTRYQQPYASFTYHTTEPYKGALATATDALGRQTTATNYKRGVPQAVRRADSNWIYATVDDNGWLTSATDAMGRTTTYDRDTMGRLTLINPPGSWANTSISYNFSGGGAVQTITRGQSHETITYDTMYRPILERTQALDSGWSSYVNTKYNASGQVRFKSQPSTNPSETKGVDYTFDGLGRIYQERENVSPYATTLHRYYSSNRHRIHDPSGAWTDYYAYGYGGPGGSDYRAIYKYANGAYQQYTYLYKNVHGQMTRLRQWGSVNGYSVDKSQYFYYDAQQRLCRHYVPEHGATKYQYDAAGQLIAYAKGQSNSGCGAVPSVLAKVSLSYDSLGRPTLTNFHHSGTPDIYRTYDANGNLKTTNRGGVNWSYSYNDINLLTNEYLDVDGRNYDLAYYYNSSGHLNRKTLPTGRNIYISLDGLGRARTIVNNSTFLASNIGYHANGSVSAVSYGNGQFFTQTLNARLLPHRLLSYKGSQIAIDQTFGYDARGKVTSIADGAVSGNNRTYGYDGLGRLTSASGPWGSGNYTYDSLDNIRQKRLGSRTVNLTYDSLNRVSQSADTGPSGTRTLAYDARGNVTTLSPFNFGYDYSDQPVSVSGAIYGSYKYDGNLKRVRSSHSNGKTIYNVYDLSGKLVHIDEVTDNKKTDYVSGPNGNLARITNHVVTFLHPNHLGSAQSGTNGAGNVLWREKYTPFGEEINGQTANDDQAGFAGHIKDKATGLNYMQARYFDPIIGRFLSIDPVQSHNRGNPSFFNRYSYSFNDPINLLDPNGREPMYSMPGGFVGSGPPTVAERDAWIQGSREAISEAYDFFVADGVDAVRSAANGDFSAAAVSATMAVFKPAKIADKANDIRKKVHGNSATSTRPQHRYEITDENGDVVKTGISGRPLNQNGTSGRANSQVNALNRADDGHTYTAVVRESNIPGRQAALDAERAATNQLARDGNTLRLQQRPKPDPNQ